MDNCIGNSEEMSMINDEEKFSDTLSSYVSSMEIQ